MCVCVCVCVFEHKGKERKAKKKRSQRERPQILHEHFYVRVCACVYGCVCARAEESSQCPSARGFPSVVKREWEPEEILKINVAPLHPLHVSHVHVCVCVYVCVCACVCVCVPLCARHGSLPGIFNPRLFPSPPPPLPLTPTRAPPLPPLRPQLLHPAIAFSSNVASDALDAAMDRYAALMGVKVGNGRPRDCSCPGPA